MGYLERVKSFFEQPPAHDLHIGDLVTCTCHGGVAIVVQLFDAPEEPTHPKMNMARIWWISPAYKDQERSWMHTIGRLSKYGAHWPE